MLNSKDEHWLRAHILKTIWNVWKSLYKQGHYTAADEVMKIYKKEAAIEGKRYYEAKEMA